MTAAELVRYCMRTHNSVRYECLGANPIGQAGAMRTHSAPRAVKE
jgi:hypothetical protein